MKGKGIEKALKELRESINIAIETVYKVKSFMKK